MTSIAIDEHLELHTFVQEEAQALYDAVHANRAHLGKWLNWVAATTTPEHSLEFIMKSADDVRDQKGMAMGIYLDGKIVGGVGMHQWNHDLKTAQVGYWIGSEYEGKGIVSKSLSALIDFLFKQVGLAKLELHYVAANERSAAVAKRLGFRIEGIIRRGALRNGQAEDLVITGLLRTEWPGRN